MEREGKFSNADIAALTKISVYREDNWPARVREMVDREIAVESALNHFGDAFSGDMAQLKEVVLQAVVDRATVQIDSLLNILIRAAEQEAGDNAQLRKLIRQIDEASMFFYTSGIVETTRLAPRLEQLMPWSTPEELAGALTGNQTAPKPPTCPEPTDEERELLEAWRAMTEAERDVLKAFMTAAGADRRGELEAAA